MKGLLWVFFPFLFAGACSVPQEITPHGETTNNTFVLANDLDLDGDGYADLGLPGGDTSIVVSETCKQAPSKETEATCIATFAGALKGLGDCDFVVADDPPVCFDGGLDCAYGKYSVCAPCIHPGAKEVPDGVDNDCDGLLGPGECAGPEDCLDDGNACTTEVCGGDSLCKTSAVICDDGNACTTNSCDPVSGCVTTVTQGCCASSADCGGDEVCGAGVCVPVPCQDDNPADCLMPIAQRHECFVVSAPNGAFCDDANACTTATTCQGGACGAGTPMNCDDGNACTTDSCDPVAGCGYAPILGCDATCNPQNDLGGEEFGDCADYRPLDADLPSAKYGWGCVPTTLVFSPLPNTGSCGPYEDADGDEFADSPESECADGIDGDLNGVVDDGPVCNPACMPGTCDDGNACTVDTCDKGVCVNSAIVNCCKVSADCGAGKVCESGLCTVDPNLDPCKGACSPLQWCEGGVCVSNGLGLVCWDDTLVGDTIPTCHKHSGALFTYWSPPLWWWTNFQEFPPHCGSTSGAPAKSPQPKCCVAPSPLKMGWQCVGPVFNPYAP